MRIVALKQEFSICKLPEDSDVRSDGEIYFIAKTDEELSLVCPTEKVPANAAARDDGWRAIRIEGVLDFSLVVSYNNIRRPERAAEQNLSNMRP